MYALYHIFPTGCLVCTAVDGLVVVVVVVCVACYLGCLLHFMSVTPQDQQESFIQSAPQDDALFHHVFTLQMLIIKFLQVSQNFFNFLIFLCK